MKIRRELFEYVPAKTPAELMTDGEIRREMPEASEERMEALSAEASERKRSRTPDQPVSIKWL